MPNDKDEIRLDRSNEAAGEPLMPGDNTIKPSDAPANFTGVDSIQKNNLTHSGSGDPEGSPDFGDDEQPSVDRTSQDNS